MTDIIRHQIKQYEAARAMAARNRRPMGHWPEDDAPGHISPPVTLDDSGRIVWPERLNDQPGE